MSGTYYQRNREVILNRAKDYYENNKELLRERAKHKYRELSEEEKNIKREYRKKNIIKKKQTKRISKNYRKAKKHILQMPIKVYYKIAITKIFFVRSFIDF